MHPFITQRFLKLGAENLINTSHHKIDNTLRRVNNPMGIGDIDGKPLEKPFINRV